MAQINGLFDILPLAFCLLFLVILPLLYVVLMSFMQKGAYGGTINKFSFEAYKSLWNVTYLKAVGRAVVLALSKK